jgi:hypothetical protein
LLNKSGKLSLSYGLLKKIKINKYIDEDLILMKDRRKDRIAWNVRIEVH